MPRLQDIISDKNVLLKEKSKKLNRKNLSKRNFVNKNQKIEYLERLNPSKKDIKDLLDMDFDRTIKTIRSNQEKQLKKALEDFDIWDLLSKIDYQPNLSHNKKIKELLKASKYLETYDFLPDFSKESFKEKIYVWVVSEVNNDCIDVCVWKFWENPVEYQIFYKDMPLSFKNKEFFRWDRVFVDMRNWEKNIIDNKNVEKYRKDQLKSLWIDIDWYKPVFYISSWGKSIRWKIIWFWDDLKLNEFIFQPDKGQKFSVSIETLKKWMNLATKKHKRKERKNTSDFVFSRKVA
jgi:hypothetical protein